MIAALFVQSRGVYAGEPGVDLWDEARDARGYQGPYPVVAHPPCSRWCRMAAVVEKRYGHRRGEDGGCFASALASVRRWGGVLEHPASSDAWKAYGLPRPVGVGNWTHGECGGWSVRVDQGHYGHLARKATWLYAFGVAALPSLPREPAPRGEYWVSWCGNHNHGDDTRPRLSKAQASATPVAFRDLLLSLAAGASGAC